MKPPNPSNTATAGSGRPAPDCSLRRRLRKSAASILRFALDCAIADRSALAGCDPDNRESHLQDARMMRELMRDLFGDHRTKIERGIAESGARMLTLRDIKKRIEAMDSANDKILPTCEGHGATEETKS